MASKNERELLRVKKLLKEVNDLREQFGEKKLEINFDKSSADSLKDNFKELSEYAQRYKEALEDADAKAGGLHATIKAQLTEMGKIATAQKNYTAGLQKTYKISQQLYDDAMGINELQGKQVKNLAKQAKIELARRGMLKAELEARKDLTDEEAKLLAQMKEEYNLQEELVKKTQERLKEEKKIQKAMGLSGAAVQGMVGLLGKIGIKGDVFEGIEADMRETAKSGSKWAVAMTGMKGIIGGIASALTDPLFIIGMIVKAVKFLLSIFNHVLKVTNEVGQAFGIAGENAKKMKEEIHAAGDRSGDMYYFTEELLSAQKSMNAAVGQNLAFNEKNAKTYQDMVLYMGMSAEHASALFKISAQMGVPFQEVRDNIVDVTNAMNKTGEYVVTTEQMIDQIAGSSGTVRFNIKGGMEGLVKAAHTASRLGMTMDEIAAAAATHLDFESSIAKEIEAEMYLQKDLNLDKLRYAAITGNTALAAQEEERLIKENYKSLKNNVLAQQAFSEATGISMDKLGEAMAKQDEMANMSGEQVRAEQAKSAELAKQGKDAATFDRTMQSAVKQIKAALEPIAKKIGPFFLKMAKKIGPMISKVIDFLSGPAGKVLLAVAGLAVGGMIVNSIAKGIMGLFGGFMDKGSYLNPMYTYNLNESGGGNDLLRGGSRIFKYFGKKGGFTRSLQRGMLKVFGKNKLTTALYHTLGKSGTFVRTLGGFSKAGNFSIGGMFEKMGKFNPFKTVTGKAAAIKYGTSGTLGAPGVASKAPGIVSKIPGGTKALSTFSKAAKVLGPLGVALDAGIGGYTGYSQSQMSAEEQKAAGVKQNIGAAEATTLGILTGGAEKGSMMSSWVGIEEGSGADEAMGVLGSAGRGAAIGATIGSIIPGVGTAIGAGVGALVGGVSESFKLLTNPDSKLRQGLDQAVGWMGDKLSEGWEGIKNFGSEAWEGISNFASNSLETLSGWGESIGQGFSDFTTWAGDGISSLANGAADMASKAGSFLMDTASSIGSSISSGVDAFVESNWNPVNWFADGGIVNKPVHGVVGEAGPEAIIPLDQAQGVLGGGTEVVALLKELITEVRKGGNVYLDGNKVGHTLALQSSQMG